jgi:hypothetical protein
MPLRMGIIYADPLFTPKTRNEDVIINNNIFAFNSYVIIITADAAAAEKFPARLLSSPPPRVNRMQMISLCRAHAVCSSIIQCTTAVRHERCCYGHCCPKERMTIAQSV